MPLMPTIRFAAGELIFEEGYPPDGAYFICSGEVEIYKMREDKKTVLGRLGDNSVFGEMALVDDRPRSATVIATKETWCYHRNKESFLEKMEDLDYAIRNVFEDLTHTIRINSKIHAQENQKKQEKLFDAQAFQTVNDEYVSPLRSREMLLKDKSLQKKVDELDVFMRAVFRSLVRAAYARSA